MSDSQGKAVGEQPNILMIMVDQMRFPRFGFGPDHGFLDPLKEIFGFQGEADGDNEFKDFFPGFWSLRQNTVVLNNHRIASSACVPSRTALFTGQYGTRTGVTQTDGLFKDGADDIFPWLKPNSFPTIGNWMRSHGYDTYYFGKWHITGEDTEDLEAYGFSDWEQSYPDPHGTLPNNLGYYRDYQFEDLSCAFLRRRGLGVPYDIAHAQANLTEDPNDGPKPTDTPTPWFAVSSFTNPHDIASYPGLPGSVYKSHVGDAEYTLAVPPQNAEGNAPFGGTMSITLNKQGFRQENAHAPLTWSEALDGQNKPLCQLDYKYKMGLSLVAKGGRLAAEQAAKAGVADLDTWQSQLDFAVEYALNTNKVGLPFALTAEPKLASEAFMQYYGYLLHEVDQHISKVLQTLEESGQADNTIVIFCPDHGEYGASHGTLMEKWHSAYEEVVHVPMIVRFPEKMRKVPGGLQQIDEITSHIDILPTILGLAGVDRLRFRELKRELQGSFSHVFRPVGEDLSDLVWGRANHVIDKTTKKPREGVLFMTHDTITEPFKEEIVETLAEAVAEGNTTPDTLNNYQVYLAAVEQLRKRDLETDPSDVGAITPGSVRQPNNVHAVISNDQWKLVRYFDENNPDCQEEYELYDLENDPNEETNLLRFDATFPTPIKDIPFSERHDTVEKANELMVLLKRLETRMLTSKQKKVAA
jgi:arylsulfatase A-like enzyme